MWTWRITRLSSDSAAAVPAARKRRQEHGEHCKTADTAWCYSTVCWTVKISICSCCHQDACKAFMGQQAMILRLIIIEEDCRILNTVPFFTDNKSLSHSRERTAAWSRWEKISIREEVLGFIYWYFSWNVSLLHASPIRQRNSATEQSVGGLHFDFRGKRNHNFVLYRLYELLKPNSAFHVQIKLSLATAGFMLGFSETEFSPLFQNSLGILDDLHLRVCMHHSSRSVSQRGSMVGVSKWSMSASWRIFSYHFSNMATSKTKIMRNISCEELGADFKPPDFTLVLLFKST